MRGLVDKSGIVVSREIRTPRSPLYRFPFPAPPLPLSASPHLVKELLLCLVLLLEGLQLLRIKVLSTLSVSRSTRGGVRESVRTVGKCGLGEKAGCVRSARHHVCCPNPPCLATHLKSNRNGNS